MCTNDDLRKIILYECFLHCPYDHFPCIYRYCNLGYQLSLDMIYNGQYQEWFYDYTENK